MIFIGILIILLLIFCILSIAVVHSEVMQIKTKILEIEENKIKTLVRELQKRRKPQIPPLTGVN